MKESGGEGARTRTTGSRHVRLQCWNWSEVILLIGCFSSFAYVKWKSVVETQRSFVILGCKY